MPLAAQIVLKEKFLKDLVERTENSGEVVIKEAVLDPNFQGASYANAPAYARRKADKYLNIIERSGDLKGNGLKEWIKQWNA